MFNSSTIDFDKTGGNIATISFEEYQKQFPVGTQVEVYILTRRVPSEFLNNELCNVSAEYSQYYCTIQRATEIFSKVTYSTKFLSQISGFPSDTDQLYVYKSRSPGGAQ